MAEICVCGHDFWTHNVSINAATGHDEDVSCNGDLGACECDEFTYLGEEEDDEQT